MTEDGKSMELKVHFKIALVCATRLSSIWYNDKVRQSAITKEILNFWKYINSYFLELKIFN